MRYTNPRLLYFTLNDFCCFRCVIEQWALTVIKLLRFFCIIIYYLLFFTIFYFFCTTMAQSHPSFINIVHVFDLYTPIKPERSVCGYTTKETALRQRCWCLWCPNSNYVHALDLQMPITAARRQIGSVVKFDHRNFDEIGSRIRPPDAQISSKPDDFCWDKCKKTMV